jgi:hypothetical protein
MARMGDTPEYINKMQQEVFEVLAGTKSLEDPDRIEPKAWLVYRRYLERWTMLMLRSWPITRE